MRRSTSCLWGPAFACAALLAAQPAFASDVSGTVTLSGSVQFAAPIAGITLDDLTVSSGPGIQATGNGEHCDIDADGSAGVDPAGLYPEAGSLSVGITIGRGGNNAPDGTCILQLRASGNDGGTVSAYGTTTVEITLADIQNNAAVAVPDPIVVRQSKAIAGMSKDCLKYTKKQMKARAKCNRTLWTKGGAEGSLKCKEAEEEPLDCDQANYAEEIVAFSFGDMNQQTDPPAALAIDLTVLSDQAKCQNAIGKAATGFVTKRNQLVQKNCVLLLADSDACRAQQVADSRAKLSLIDNCVATQGTDGNTGLFIADVDEPCKSLCYTGDTLDRKCLKDCFELELSTFSDLMIGDVPECGNGIEQGGEFCDDGNAASGDCCSATCTIEPAGSQTCGVGACEASAAQCNPDGTPATCTPGMPSAEICDDGIDNDCDGLLDAADVVDCP